MVGGAPAEGGVQRGIAAQFLHRSRRGWRREASVLVVMVVVVVVVSVVPVGQGGRIGSLEGKKQEVCETCLFNFFTTVELQTL